MKPTISTIRARLGLSRRALATALEMSPATLSRYEAGEQRTPRHVWLACLALWHRLDHPVN